MNTCPYCGGLGRHIWAGTGQCPGIQEDETERLKAVIQAQKIALGDQRREIERLKIQIENERRHYAEDSRDLQELITLCVRAADALDVMTQFLLVSDIPLEWEENKRRENMKLITELRNSEK